MDEDVFSDDEIGKVELPVEKYFSGAYFKEALKIEFRGKEAGTLNVSI